MRVCVWQAYVCLMGVCAFLVISTLVTNCLNPIQRFVDLGWHSVNVILDNININNSGNVNVRKQGQSAISQNVYAVCVFIKGN